LQRAGIPHWRLPLHTSAEFSPQVMWSACRLMKLAANERIDLIHAHTRVAQVVAECLWHGLRVPYVATWHGFFKPRWSRRGLPCTGRLTIAISEPVAEHLHKDFRVPVDRIRTIPHGVDLARFQPPPTSEEQRACRAQLNLPPDGPIVGTMARLVASKGVDRLIKAFAAVRASAPNARLLIIGDGEDRARLEAFAATHEVGDAVRFAGALTQTRAPLSIMDVFVFLPATQEGFGLSLLEAMASARPVVAVKQGGGAPWLIDQIGTTVAVDAEKPEQLARAIAELLRDSIRARTLGQRGLTIVRDRYTFDREVTETEAVYTECLEPR